MNSTDPSSLQNLNDIIVPAPVGWWPLATGWYVIFGLLLATLIWFAYKYVKHRNANRYRRAALSELLALEADINNPATRDSSVRKLPLLLKRTALSAYPRDQVASLSGANWHSFLNSKIDSTLFTESELLTLDRASYSVGELSDVDQQTANAFFEASKKWLKYHQAPTADDAGKGS